MVGESEDRRDYAHINALLLETRETVIRLDANLNSKLDILLQTREDLEDRLGKVEEKCEIKRIRMESFTPILATVYGVGPHDPGLVQRMKRVEEEIGIGSGHESVSVQLDNLHRNTITWQALMALTGAFAAIWTVVMDFAVPFLASKLK